MRMGHIEHLQAGPPPAQPAPKPASDGGPAFPDQGQRLERDGTWNQQWSSGMSLRAYLAGKALQGMLAAPEISGTYSDIAMHAVKYADAMIAELGKEVSK